MVSGTTTGGSMSASTDSAPPSRSRSSTSRARISPTGLSMPPSHTSSREWPDSLSTSRSATASARRSTQTSSLRGVMIARTGRSASRSRRSIMLRSSCSSTPAWAPSAISARSSSSVTVSRPVLVTPNRRSTSDEDCLSSHTAGAATRDSTRSGSDKAAAMRSGRRSASCLGTSSPSTSMRAVIAITHNVSASSCANGASTGTRASHGARRPAMLAPPKVPSRMVTRVMPTCTVGRKLCGSSASSAARSAPGTPRRTSTASLARRDEIRASSPIANTPLSSTRSRITTRETTMMPF